MKKSAIALAVLLLVPAAWVQGQGHRIMGSEVVIGSQRQWENWSFAPGTLEISSQGEVTPRFYRRNINAVEDIASFLRLRPPENVKKDPEDIELIDALDAGSNRADVVNVLDGDMSTYWEPDPPTGEIDLASQWWFSVDLGRYVIAKKLVLKFVDEELGDPFLLFDVLVSRGEKPTANIRSPIPEYQTVQRTLSPNKSQREFVVELPEDIQLNGKGIRFVQVIITGTDSTRAQEVSQEDYELLAAADRGQIEYYKRLSDGRETAVDAGIYSLLDEERQGSIRYFRREHPRLAELEVWAEGDEILIETLARGGTVSATQSTSLTSFFDGDVVSKGTLIQSFGSLRNPEGQLLFDLGSFFWIDTYRIIFATGRFIDYHLDFSDGGLAADGSLKWTITGAPKWAGGLSEGYDFERLKARYFRIVWEQWETGTGSGGASAQPREIQLYGEGFQPEVTLESDLVTLGGSRNLLSVEWDADMPPGTKVLLQTRTGAIMDTLRTYFKKPLSPLLPPNEVTKEQYEALSASKKGDIVEEVRQGSDWSDWSEPYENAAGSPITSPSPRQFLMLRATLLSDDPAFSATLKSIRLKFGNPVAKGLLGEIFPFLVDSLGIERSFSLFLRPDFDIRDSGFDQLLLTGPPDMDFSFAGVYGGREEALLGEGVDLADLALADVEVMETDPDSLRVMFDPVRPNSGIEVVRLDFRTALFGAGALLKASLQNSATEGDAWQRVDAGDAVVAIGGNTTTLIGTVGTKELIRDVAVLPHAFTPNGDGINDEVRFVFKVVKVGDDSPVEIDIHDLGGRRLRRMVERRALSTGEYEMRWDGRDDAGEMVPPGIYYARLRIDTDTEGANLEGELVLRTVSVAY